ncbi:MAG: TylF/MycF/NovP-related O-methyltransferase, partial [Pseudomonadota bacterium]|nr:TylF/MycF/NovP-related O-methyltransferase [Pseudomonadota bacterium]
VDAYQSTKDIIEWCLPRMSQGGVIIFDDYGFRGCEGVTEYVNELMKIDSINQNYHFIHNLNGHAILIRN